MLKKTFINLLVAFIVLLSCGLAQATTVTIATFADPAGNGSTPLFTVDLANDLITAGWDGLTLEIPYFGHTYTDVLFTMTDVFYGGDITGGVTGGGDIDFFKDGQMDPLIHIHFNSGHVTPSSFGAMDMFYLDGVTISGSELGSSILTGGSFAFSFSNQMPLSGDWDNGFTATSSFTSSAEIPEPATIVLLGTAGIWVFTRKKRSA